MLKKLLFGVAYYPEYLKEDRIDKDFEMMKAAGMNTVRIAESTWSTLEPEEGVFNYSYIDALLKAAERHDLDLIVGTPSYAVPPWLVKKDPAVLLDGKNHTESYGRRQNMDIMNLTYRRHVERAIRMLMERTASHTKVIGFQIDNECKDYGNFSANVQADFVEHLKEKFKTVEAFNEAFGLAYWSNSIGHWDDMPDMRGTINGGLATEFASFKRSQTAGYLKWQAALVDEYRREDQFITHNFDFEWRKFGADIAQDGYSYGVQPDLNHAEASEAVTLAGTDIYHPTQDELTGAEIAYGGDSIRSLKMDNYLVLECQAQAFKYWTPYPGQLRQQAYSHLASGADGIMYWNWHSIHNSFETYWKGLLSHDMESNPTYEEAVVFGNEWKKLNSELLHLKKNNRVALVTDNNSLDALKWFPLDWNLSYNDVVRWMYDSLYEMNIECDIVDINVLDTSAYDMIVTPVLYSITEEKLNDLKSFVEKGGVLFSSFKSFISDENLTVFMDKAPHILSDVFGMFHQQYAEPRELFIDGHKVEQFAELLQPAGAEVLASYTHQYWGRYAAATKNSFGEGKAYYIGGFTEKDYLKSLLKQAAADAGITVPELEAPLAVRSGTGSDGQKISYLFNYSMEARTAANPCGEAVDLLTGYSYNPGEKIEISDWGVCILKEK
ncbi:MAG: beta-galactosidase [Spirochaetales bacterium]|nr:beta-galactosidase [Spirochaetales bacterium]